MNSLQQGGQEPEGLEKAQKVHTLRGEVRRLWLPLQQFVPSLWQYDEDNGLLDERVCGQPKDVAADNPTRDTLYKFKPTIERMERLGVFGTEEVVVDGETVTVNRKWKQGDTWGPESQDSEETDPSEEDYRTPTFHGFLPRHSRPNRIGLGHLGYDDVYIRSRDGKPYTADDLPDREWRTSRHGPMRFVSDEGNTVVINHTLSPDNPVLQTDPVSAKPLRQILEENQRANAGRGAYQGRSNRNRGGPSQAVLDQGGFGSQLLLGPVDQSWN